ncbi:forkhead box protein N4-like [Paramormyrops kingsleyae]|uniref:forkhead box protein N4-like n=1 Tax=Paramormyrops kingsleyae TaxID=1676925 RepID=UPI000CD66B94|nr:forkhead box protein N4-like [Paramormyrops kingsleyae]
MIESGIAPQLSGTPGSSGPHATSQDYRLLTLDPSQLAGGSPGDLQPLSWLTSVDVHRLQQRVAPQSGLPGGAQVNSMSSTEGRDAMGQLYKSAETNVNIAHHGNMAVSCLAGQVPLELHPHLALLQPSQVFALAPIGQQCPAVGLYSSASFSSQTQFLQPHLDPHNEHELQPTVFPKPIYSYSCLIAMALKNSQTGSLPVSEIYSFMKEHFPYFKTAPDGWKNSVRHNLSLNKCFEKVENKLNGSSRKGCLWALNPARIERMEEEMLKWKLKDLAAIRRSMANPDELDRLIMDRPESCRQELCDPSVTHLAIQPIPSPALLVQTHPHVRMGHSMQQNQLLVVAQAPLVSRADSPCSARTTPLHTVPDISQQQMEPPQDLYGLHSDISPEVDALDPSITDFALHGNLWEEMKDESFNLETLGSLSDSPLRLSDCELVLQEATPPSGPGAAPVPFPDLQVTGLYATFAASDPGTSSTQYSNTHGGSRPIVLL